MKEFKKWPALSMTWFIVTIVAILGLLLLQYPLASLQSPVLRIVAQGMLVLLGVFLLLTMKEYKSTLLSESTALFCSICFYLTGIIFLYDGSGDIYAGWGLIVPALLVLAVYYISVSASAQLCYFFFCGYYLLVSGTEQKRLIYFLLLLGVVPMMVRLYRENRETYKLRLFELGIGMAGFWLFYMDEGSSSFGIWFFLLYTYCVILFLLHYRIFSLSARYYQSPLKMLGLLGMIGLFIWATRTAGWDSRIIPDAGQFIHLEFFLLLLLLSVLVSENILRGKIDLEQVAVCGGYFLSFGFYVYFEFFNTDMAFGMNFYFLFVMLAACIIGLIIGARRRDRHVLIAWIGGFVLYLSSLMIESDHVVEMTMLTAFAIFLVWSAASARYHEKNRIKRTEHT